jgi:hypothetical protein
VVPYDKTGLLASGAREKAVFHSASAPTPPHDHKRVYRAPESACHVREVVCCCF